MRRLIEQPEFPRNCSVAGCREQVPGPDAECARHSAMYQNGELGQCLTCGKRMEAPAYWGNNCASCAYKQSGKVNRQSKNKHAGTLYSRQLGKCPYCGRRLTIGETPDYNTLKAQLDHKKPRSKGGRDNLDNLQLTCEHCNKQKSAMNDADYRIYKNALKPLF